VGRQPVAKDGVIYNGGARYLPKTDGRRNACFERLFLTVSPRFEEVLPNIPNPKSPWMHVAASVCGGPRSQRSAEDYDTWKRIARYGMTKVVITTTRPAGATAGRVLRCGPGPRPAKGRCRPGKVFP